MIAVPAFIPALASGAVLAHIFWPDRRLWALVTKAFLGVGIGLGLRSLLYFLYLLVLPGRNLFIYFDLALLACLIAVAARREAMSGAVGWSRVRPAKLNGTQWVLVIVSGLVFVVSLLSTANYLLRRRQGDWDAWMMYNRAARFIHFDQANWRESFSELMHPIFHADYPLLLGGSIAASWELVGGDSAAVPMIQSALFAIACVGLTVGALALVKSVGQAALAVTFLWGIPVFVNEGARQMADVPMAFYVLATGILLYLYVNQREAGLLVLGGITTGLAAWTKNEGAVFVIAAAAAMVIALAPRPSWRLVLRFSAGLALPLAIVLYFKLFMAPSGDILSGAAGGLVEKITELSRHTVILRYLWNELTGFGGWGIAGLGIGILPILALYYLIFRSPIPVEHKPAFAAGFVMLGIQLLGYYAAYLVSPYDLEWHLSYSSTRIVLQLFPLLLFLTLCASREAEKVLSPAATIPTE
jgi:hypothetical protein